MACPVCGKVYCFHTPNDRGQSLQEIVRDRSQDFETQTKKLREIARELICRGGEKNYKKAVALVGPREAKKIQDEMNQK